MARNRLAAVGAGLGAFGAAIAIALSAGHPLDYASPACSANPLCDDGAPAIDALVHGHVGTFFDRQPLMGPVSLLLRAPFAAVAGGGELARYRAGLLACLLVVAALGAVLARLAAERGRPWWFQFLVAVGTVVNPVTFRAVDFGHPEELLGAALVAGAGLAAVYGRAKVAGLLAGLAIGTKLWAILALPVLIVVLPLGRRRLVTATGVTAVLLIAIPALGAPAHFRENLDSLGNLGSSPGGVSRTDIWFPAVKPVVFYAPVGVDKSGAVIRSPVPAYDVPDWIGRLGHALILAAAVAVAVFWQRRGRPGAPERALLAVALVMLLRCILDSGTRSYYHAPFLLAAIAYGAVASGPALRFAVAGALGIEAFSRAVPHIDSDGLLGAAYLAWSLPLAVAMLLEVGRKTASNASGSDQIR